MPMVLTKRQHEVLQFLQEFIEREGYCPSYEEMAAGLKLTSLATVHAHMVTLEKKGCLRRGFNQSRSIEIRRSASKRAAASAEAAPGSLPLLGRIAAGRPVEAVAGHEQISLNDIT